MTQCPLCKARLRGASVPKHVAHKWAFTIEYVDCPCCGCYGLQADDLPVRMEQFDSLELATMAAFVCERHLAGIKPVILWSNRAEAIAVRDEAWVFFDTILTEFPLPPITERPLRALLNLSKLAATPGQRISITKEHIGLFYAEDDPAAQFVLGALLENGSVRSEPTHDGTQLHITLYGWRQVEEFNKGRVSANAKQAFVAMWFDPGLNEAYELGISPAIVEAGFKPVRIDRTESNNQITDDIVAEIRRSQFMVVDCTGHRPAVYYEAGLMHGLGRPVIFTCRASDLVMASFDTNHYPHITWAEPLELKQRLMKRIQATIIS